VAGSVGLANAGLIVLAAMATAGREIVSIAGACVVVGSLLIFLAGGRQQHQPSPGNE
jgi:hypothetical protein